MAKLKGKKPTEVKPGHVKTLFYGPPGAGKTFIATDFPFPYMIDTEGGSRREHYLKKLDKAGGHYLGPADGSNSFDTILQEMETLATTNHPFKTLIVDSLTKVFDTEVANEVQRIEDAGKKDEFGSSKKAGYKQMRKLFAKIERLDMNQIFICHSISKWETIKGERQEVGKTPDVWFKMEHELDLVLEIMNPRKRFRVARVHKTRLLGFPEYDTFTVQEGEDNKGFGEFSRRYGKENIDAAPVALTLCDKEQLKEINRLIKSLRIDPKEIEKILAKANAEEFKELTKDQADKFIIWLNKKLEKGEKEDA